MGREVSINVEDNADLYPQDWFSNNDYKKRIQILVEAIKNKCLIINTEGYQDIIEGVKTNNEDER